MTKPTKCVPSKDSDQPGWAPVAYWIRELTLNPLCFELRSGHVGKPSSAYGWSGGFPPGSPVFAHL